MPRKILVVGDPNSVFVRDFIEQYSKCGVTVDLLSTAVHDVGVHSLRRQISCYSSVKSTSGKLRRALALVLGLIAGARQTDKDYDATVIHFIYYPLFLIATTLRKRTRTLACVVWGSDFYRSHGIKNHLRSWIYNACDKIIFTNPKTQADFLKKNPAIPATKTTVARFGLPALDEIDKLIRTGTDWDELRKEFGFPTNKLIVLVGYSSRPTHRQSTVIESLSHLSTAIRNEIHLVFPLGYGESNIKQEIERCLADRGWTNYSILTKFYDFAQVARLRVVTDVLVNIQATDQFSGSMQETLYAGGTVIAGAWLPYSELIEGGCDIRSIEQPNQIAELITTIIKERPRRSIAQCEACRTLIQELSSWKYTIGLWDKALFDKAASLAHES